MSYTTIEDRLPINEESGGERVIYHVYTPPGMSDGTLSGASEAADTAAAPRAIVQILHGMCEHMGRFGNMAQALTDAGFICCGLDRRGHGKTAFPDDITEYDPNDPLESTAEAIKRRRYGNLGYFGDGVTHERLYEDEDALRRLMSERYPELPYIFYGHSMGSLMTRAYVGRHPDVLDGIILSGTLDNHGPIPSMGLTLAHSLVRRYGERHISKRYRNLFFFNYIHGIEADGPVAFNSADAEVRDEFLADPRCHFNYTMSAYREMLHTVLEANGDGFYKSVPPELPILIISGEDDPFGGRGRGVGAVQKRLLANDHDPEKLKTILYPKMRHDIVHEREHAIVAGDVCGFVSEIADSAAFRSAAFRSAALRSAALRSAALPQTEV